MLIHMRTTLVLDDHLLRDAKRRAADRGITVSDLVNEALRAALRHTRASAPRFQMITFGERAPSAHHEPSDFANALEAEERSSLAR